jgi:hypothetical protein
VKVIGIVQDNLPMYVFSIDIPFKGSQSLSNMRSKVTAVSYLLSGVNDTAVPCAAKSDFLIKKTVCLIIREDVRKKVGCSPVYQGPRGSCLMKKNRGRKSRVRVPLKTSLCRINGIRHKQIF